MSIHLACLRGCGIVVAEPEGRRTRYEIADAHLPAALTALVDTTLALTGLRAPEHSPVGIALAVAVLGCPICLLR